MLRVWHASSPRARAKRHSPGLAPGDLRIEPRRTRSDERYPSRIFLHKLSEITHMQLGQTLQDCTRSDGRGWPALDLPAAGDSAHLHHLFA